MSYATDASVYREVPYGVAFPKNEEEIIEIIHFAKKNHLSIIPRGAGTSLAGQVVGKGIVVDISQHFRSVIEIDEIKRTATVQPGVIRDDLNLLLKSKNLFFAPETATSNRCTIGGMCGNNSCGANSLIVGSTRQHILKIKAILSDGSTVGFKELSDNELDNKCALSTLEGKIYREIIEKLSSPSVQQRIKEEFPHPDIPRRSMGYAIDELLAMKPFNPQGKPFNLSKLITGAEGTLVFITELTLILTPLPPQHKALLAVSLDSIAEALEVNIHALTFQPSAIELIDGTILKLAFENITQSKNRSVIEDSPNCLLVIEVNENSWDEVERKIESIRASLIKKQQGYHFKILTGSDMEKVWALRKSGLGTLSNMQGKKKPVTVVEDIALLPQDYPHFYHDFVQLLEKYQLQAIFYAHISTGELHNKPLFNLKNKKEQQKFKDFAYETAILVKKYRGSLSGEHGDGRLRGEFLPLMIGKENYELLRNIKYLFDPDNLFNPRKIVDTPPMNENLRFQENEDKKVIQTFFDFSNTDGILNAIEKCSGSADCRKSSLQNGTMCPSYRATLNENNSTRSRANIIREFVLASKAKNPFDHREILEALDNCLACKACKSECPSNVDMTKLRAEFLYQYYRQHRQPIRSLIIAYYPILNHLAMPFSAIYNFFITNKTTSSLLKRVVQFSPLRSLPTLHRITLRQAYKKEIKSISSPIKTVYLFVDEFTNTQDVEVGIIALRLLQSLQYQVKIVKHSISGRTFLSKGLLKQARKVAEKNITIFSDLISNNSPLIGIEPSAILSFRDEYSELISEHLQEKARELSKNTFLIDEFLANEFENGNISSDAFSDERKTILFHAHCYQKVLSDLTKSVKMMEIPTNYQVKIIDSGCCGMAGAFGYEKEHYSLSMAIGELSLFPAIRNKKADEVITATGTSCRHQIKDGTNEKSYHPIEILYQALKKHN